MYENRMCNALQYRLTNQLYNIDLLGEVSAGRIWLKMQRKRQNLLDHLTYVLY